MREEEREHFSDQTAKRSAASGRTAEKQQHRGPDGCGHVRSQRGHLHGDTPSTPLRRLGRWREPLTGVDPVFLLLFF